MQKDEVNAATLPLPKSRGLAPGDHRFETTYFYLPTACAFCGGWIWPTEFAVKCKDCSYTAHEACSLKVPKECRSRLRRMRSLTSPLEHRKKNPQKSTSTNSLSKQGIIHEGPLLKMAHSDASWQNTWCVCKEEALYVYPAKVQFFTPLIDSINK
jgi:hypothetical protein